MTNLLLLIILPILPNQPGSAVSADWAVVKMGELDVELPLGETFAVTPIGEGMRQFTWSGHPDFSAFESLSCQDPKWTEPFRAQYVGQRGPIAGQKGASIGENLYNLYVGSDYQLAVAELEAGGHCYLIMIQSGDEPATEFFQRLLSRY
ncbi:MAG: hypothetical protein KDC71_24240 [Acidobacteria bacterium]|nr:hypothetical protein [Acidobacteriota bacterium]